MAVEGSRDDAMKNIMMSTPCIIDTLNVDQSNAVSLQEKLNANEDDNIMNDSTGRNSGHFIVRSAPTWDARENKPPSKQKYPGTVSIAELNLMRLSAKTCRSANALLPRDPIDICPPIWSSPSFSHCQQHGGVGGGWQKRKLANGFCVRNCNQLYLIPELGLPETLLQEPGPFCTDADTHRARLKNSQLSQACPTCWSSQRHR